MNVLLDRTGEVTSLLEAKRRLPDEAAAALAREELDSYVNSTARSLRNGLLGLEHAARLDAAESVPYLLTTIFALEARVRPFNKYLEAELRERPLAEPAWAADTLLPQLAAAVAPGPAVQHALFREVERAARAGGLGDVIDSWEPDVAWLRGEAPYRG